MKIINVKVNGKLVDKNTKIKGVHLCGDFCPVDVMMNCPKIKTSSKLPIDDYQFITEGKQIVRINEYEKVNDKIVTSDYEVEKLVVTKCKRYDEAMQKIRNRY